MTANIETIACDFCHSKEYTSYDSVDSWNIVTCKNCNFYYTNPRPTTESLPYYYLEAYFMDERHKSKFYNEDGTIKSESANYTNRIMDAESFITKRGRILEIGAARGAFLHLMRQRGWQVDGVEISQDACDYAKKLYDVSLFCGTLDGFSNKEKYEVVCMYQTLEHVPNPKYVIERSHELLNTNGLIVIEVPNLNCFEMKYSKERRRLSYDLPRHLNHFTPSFLKKQLEQSNFEIVTIIRNEDVLLGSFLERRALRAASAIKSNDVPTDKVPVSAPHTDLPMLKYPKSRAQSIIQKINWLMPGWRFTIIGRKK